MWLNQCFVLLLLNVPINRYGHVGTIASYFMGLLPDIEMNDTPIPAINHCPSKQLGAGRHIIYTGQTQASKRYKYMYTYVLFVF